MLENEVIEFIILPPFKRRSEVGAARERFEAYLSTRFRRYSFTVSHVRPVNDDGHYTVLPVQRYVDSEGCTQACEPPKRWIMREIAEACIEFDASWSAMA